MSEYLEYLPELKSTTLFQGIGDSELIALLDAMRPEIVCRKAGTEGVPQIDFDEGLFCVVLRGKPLDKLAPRPDVYNMPKITEPGMMMGEIPCLSEMLKSRAPKIRFRGGGHAGPGHDDFDLYMLRMSGEMITRFHGIEHSGAQGRMLRNFLGILAQKVTDVRKEKAQLSYDYNKALSPYRLNILCAGVSLKLVKQTADIWNKMHPELPAVVTTGSSVDIIRDCISGYPCDLLVSADDSIIESMLMPDYVSGYRIWGGNKMVICGEGISPDNWIDRLLASGASFKHKDPYGDPGGYRAVMAMLLADKVEPGLSGRLMNHPGHIGMEKNPGPFGNMKPADYSFTYLSAAVSMGVDYTELPAVMDLSDPDLASEYAEVSFAVDKDNTVTATPIAHALAIPKTSLHLSSAAEFAELFLNIDKSKHGFLLREGTAGTDPLTLKNR